MRKVRDVLRLKHTLGMSLREISEATGVSKTVVGEYVRRAKVIGIAWPVPEAINDAELERLLFPIPYETGRPRAAIDWRKVHEEMKRRSVTLVLDKKSYAVGQRARRHPSRIGDRQRDVGEKLGRRRPAAQRAMERNAEEARPRVEDRRLDTGARHLSERRSAVEKRPEIAVVHDHGAAQARRRGGDRGEQFGLILACDRRQGRRLAEPGRARAVRTRQRGAHQRRPRRIDSPGRDHERLAQGNRQRFDVDRDNRDRVGRRHAGSVTIPTR